jgi:pimeloyl-ACP methyl ester carboxylesterase
VTTKLPPQTNPESEFCVLNDGEDSRLSDVERLTLLGGAALDRVLSKLGRSLSSVSLDTFAPGLDLSSLKASQIRLNLLRSSGDIDKLFASSDTTDAPSIIHVHGFPEGGVFDLRFSSHFPRGGWSHDPGYSSIEENTTSYVRVWEHTKKDPNRLTVIAIHGWTMGDQRVNSLAFLPGLFFSLGCNVALVELPFHGRRRPTGLPEDLPLFPSADPVRTCVAMAHALYDLRRLRSYLSRNGHSRIACVGMSLGAYVGALWASMDRLDRAAFLVPLVSMSEMARDLFVRSGLGPVSEEFLEDLFRDHSPLKRAPATDPSSIIVIGGEGDHLVPKTQITLLQKHWPNVNVEWAKGGHGAAANRSAVFDRVSSFLMNTKS